jgi:nicotinate-nucleotide adenylyltransferase
LKVERPSVALFGGSFNPPHEGHVLAAAHVLSIGAVERVLVVPVYEHALRKRLVGFERRVAMARLAFEWLPGVEVSTIEAELGAPSRTLRTVEALQERYPTWDLRLMVGSDILREIHQWHAFDEIVRRAPLLVLKRAGVSQGEVSECQLPLVSSTEVRQLLQRAPDSPEARSALETLVPRNVRDYAQEHRLYAVNAPVNES